MDDVVVAIVAMRYVRRRVGTADLPAALDRLGRGLRDAPHGDRLALGPAPGPRVTALRSSWADSAHIG